MRPNATRPGPQRSNVDAPRRSTDGGRAPTVCARPEPRHPAPSRLLLGVALATPLAADCAFTPGQPWLDTDGRPIDAHGGGILLDRGVYYWYGESHREGAGNRTGVTVYSSRDLCRWKNEGLALPKDAVPERFRDTGVCERPKVVRNARTGRYVMWMHLDADDYTAASAGVAEADSPTGPFRFLHASRPIRHDYGYSAKDRAHERERGNTYRDMNLFVDDDGTAYVFYASEDNATTYVARLAADYTKVEEPAVLGKTWARVLPGAFREAPAPFKHAGRYYMLTSGTTGWAPNPADLAVADHPFGPWRPLGNPFTGPGGRRPASARRARSCCRPPASPPGHFVYLGDRWNGSRLEASTYVWLPFVMRSDGSTSLVPLDRWGFSAFEAPAGPLAAPRARVVDASGVARAARLGRGGGGGGLPRPPQRSAGRGDRVHHVDRLRRRWPGEPTRTRVAAFALVGETSPPSPAVAAPPAPPREIWLSEVEPDAWRQGYGPLGRDAAILGTPISIGGRRFARGLATHAASEIAYHLGGQYARFTASVGRDDSHPEGSVVFRVEGDGRAALREPGHEGWRSSPAGRRAARGCRRAAPGGGRRGGRHALRPRRLGRGPPRSTLRRRDRIAAPWRFSGSPAARPSPTSGSRS